MTALALRRATPDDDQAVRRLLSDVLPGNSKVDPDVMRWQYWENPYGRPISFVWTDDGRIVCHYASIPVPLVVNHRPRRGLIGVDAATDPAYRGQGLFSQIVAESAKVCVEEGYRVLFFFPAPGSALPSAADTPALAMPLKALPLDHGWLGRRLGLPAAASRIITRLVLRPPRSGTAREVSGPPAGLNELWDAMRISSSIVKDDTWWQWRYAKRPQNTYRYFEHREGERLTGAAVTTTTDVDGPVVYILDVLACDLVAGRALVGAIAAEHLEARAIGFRSTKESPQSTLVRAGGLRPVPSRSDPQPPSLAVFEADPEARHIQELPWAWSWGDLDHL